MTGRVVVVGAGAAGMSAASAARRVDKDLEVVVLESGRHAAYGLCGLPYYLSDAVGDVDDLRAYPPAYFQDERGIDLRLGTGVVRVDAERQVVHVRGSGRPTQLHYDRLVLGAGAAPVVPPIAGVDDSHVFAIRTVEDSVRLRGLLDAGHVGRAVVVGGGYIGLEITESLAERGVSVTLVEALPRLMANVDPEFSATIEAEVRRHAQLRLETTVKAVGRADGELRVTLDNGSTLGGDVVVLAVGVRPCTVLAEAMGADLGPGGAVLVDNSMRTSVPDVFAAGDCVALPHLVTGRPAYVPLGPAANKTGRVAGTVAAGGQAAFAGVVGTAVVKVFGLSVARTGLSLTEARAAGLDAYATDSTGRSRAKYYPGSEALDVRLVHGGDGRLLGAQFAGQGDGAAKRVDVAAVALQAGLSVSDLTGLDLSYAPPFAPVYEPLILAANAAMARNPHRQGATS